MMIPEFRYSVTGADATYKVAFGNDQTPATPNVIVALSVPEAVDETVFSVTSRSCPKVHLYDAARMLGMMSTVFGFAIIVLVGAAAAFMGAWYVANSPPMLFIVGGFFWSMVPLFVVSAVPRWRESKLASNIAVGLTIPWLLASMYVIAAAAL